jgi:isochorismate synthase/2-succinyl-5-enolpyruvyl-6-hydroxy-3-cyclohexene-1-carboxylate synthase/2-succinyl-6-hydroxy-2,4-cyclohexadiene-1-carboxylate synthase/O-succinylbenzoate synthase
VATGAGTYSFRCLEAGSSTAGSSNGSSSSSNGSAAGSRHLLLLHGFMGSADDWLPAMQALSPWASCTAIDLPGHGYTATTCSPAAAALHSSSNGSSSNGSSSNGSSSNGSSRLQLLQQAEAAARLDPAHTLEAAADAVAALVLQKGLQGCTLVGYSLGARLALVLTQRHPGLFSSGVIISGTAGMPDAQQRSARSARDDELADLLETQGLGRFLEFWYDQPLLAKALRAMSTGRMASMWGQLPQWPVPLLLVAGELDSKFVQVNRKMHIALMSSSGSEGQQDGQQQQDQQQQGPQHHLVTVPDCGHAVHVEKPLLLVELLRTLLQ